MSPFGCLARVVLLCWVTIRKEMLWCRPEALRDGSLNPVRSTITLANNRHGRLGNPEAPGDIGQGTANRAQPELQEFMML